MADPFENLKGPTARKMAAEMSNSQTLMWVGVAFLVHVVILGATSAGYIRDTYIDPKGAEARHAKAAADAKAAQAAQAPAPVTPATSAPAPATASAGGDKPKAPADPDAAMLEKNKNNPVIKSITDTAKPSETPKAPTRNGFNFDDDALK